MTNAEKALDYVRDGTAIGLGTGRAATEFVRALGARVRDGLRVRGVPTSRATAELAASLGIALVELADEARLDVTIDGADEVDPHLDLIKGYGGALVREKIVAASSNRLVILVGKEKIVTALGARGRLPVEVVPFGLALCRRRLGEIGCAPVLRVQVDGKPFLTDNGNYILDCGIEPISDPPAFDGAIRAIPGVVGTGLFVGMAAAVLVQDGDRVDVRERPSAA
jgi:ribose 5-phosphate isomerase A